MKEFFIEHRFSKESERLIELINGILDEYAKMGYTLELMQYADNYKMKG